MSTLKMERSWRAEPKVVFDAITQTEFLLQWWGPEGTTIGEHNLDFSMVGPWSAVMIGPQGHGAKVGGEVLSIDPPNFVEFSLRFQIENDDWGPESVIRFDVVHHVGGTRLILTQTGLEAEHIEDMKNKGWASALQRLEILLPTVSKQGD